MAGACAFPIRSVNHRFLDLHLRVPEGFEPLEPRIRQIVRERVRRGHLDVTLYYELAGPAAVGVNQEVAAAYVQAVNSLRQEFGIHSRAGSRRHSALARSDRAAGCVAGRRNRALEAVVARCLNEALDKLDHMREEEGERSARGNVRAAAHHCRARRQVEMLAERARPAFARRLERA